MLLRMVRRVIQTRAAVIRALGGQLSFEQPLHGDYRGTPGPANRGAEQLVQQTAGIPVVFIDFKHDIRGRARRFEITRKTGAADMGMEGGAHQFSPANLTREGGIRDLHRFEMEYFRGQPDVRISDLDPSRE